MQSGFASTGRRYELRDPNLIPHADSDLWNEKMYIQIDHRGKVCYGGFMSPQMKSYADSLRLFYLRDDSTGEIWSVPQESIPFEYDSFLFSAGKSDVTWKVTYKQIECSVRLVVPKDDSVELWTVKIHNKSNDERKISLFSYLPIGLLSWFRQDAMYNEQIQGVLFSYLPYYAEYQDYFDMHDQWNKVYVISDTEPDSYMFNQEEFIGNGTLSAPDALQEPYLPAHDRYSDADLNMAAVMHFERELASEEMMEVNFAFGPAHSMLDAKNIRDRYFRQGGIDAALKEAESLYDEFTPAITIKTPDQDFDAFINHWQSRRSLMLLRSLRFDPAPQGRNAIQDAMGGVLIDPECSRSWFLKIWEHQHTTGWLPHGIPFIEGIELGPIKKIPHKDINSWGPLALTYYLYETGDYSILDEEIIFGDDQNVKASLYEHINLGLDWLLADRTERGLSRIGQGDWNDPLNMAGIEGKGESVWLSEALSLALDTWAPVCDMRSDHVNGNSYRQNAIKLRDTVNDLAWDGEWYLRGFTDAGRPFGSHKEEEGRIFLNAQSWAVMSGTANVDRLNKCVKAVNENLNTPSGPITLAPAYTRMYEDIGKICQKTPGRTENGSVYCHASTFYAYALFKAGQSDRAFKILRNLLPGTETNPIIRAGQLPLYIPNYFRGPASGRTEGQSSHSANTGTAAWYYRTVVDGLFGLRAEADGLRVDPQIPGDWKQIQVFRRWRQAEFDIEIKRSSKAKDAKECVVILNNEELKTNMIPPQAPNTSHKVLVYIREI